MATSPSRTSRQALAALAVVALSLGSAAHAAEPPAGSIAIVDADATADTRSLFAYLKAQQDGGILFGQQHVTDVGVTFGESDGVKSDVFAGTGEYPAVFGWDSLIIDGREPPGVPGDTAENNARRLADGFVRADALGGINTLSTHLPNFVTGGDFTDTDGRVVSQILPGGSKHAEYNDYLDLIALAATSAVRDDGSLVPVIYRPFHENTGSWFWWGAAHATAGEYKEIFRYTVEYLRDTKDVHNLLYSFSPNGSFGGDAERYLATYPGDQWVDVLGYDFYEGSDTNENSDAFIAAAVEDLAMVTVEADARGKIPAFTEFGRNGDRTIKESGNKSLTYYTDLLAALKADPDASRIAYMLTWANWDLSQFYVPYPAFGATPEHEMFEDFTAFYADPETVFSAGVGSPYTTPVTAAPAAPALRFVSPADGVRVVDATTTVRTKLTGVDPAAVQGVTFTMDGEATVHTLTLDADGYWSTEWEIGEENLTNATATLRASAVVEGAVVPQAVVEIVLGEAVVLERGVVDDFEGYGDDVALRAAYSVENASSSVLSLADAGGSQGARLSYSFASADGYLGFGKAYSPAQNWSGFGHFQADIVPDGSDHKMVIQITAGGIAFEAYPSLAGTEPYTATLSFEDFVPAAWDTANAGKTLTPERLSQVTKYFTFLNNDGGPASGSIVVDNLRTGGDGEFYEPAEPTADPVLIDDFESYADTAALRAAWGNRNGAEQLSLSTDPVGSGDQAAAFTYDFTTQGYTEVSRWLGSADWSLQKQLSLWIDPAGDGQNLLIQFKAGGTYYEVNQPLSGLAAGDVHLLFADAIPSAFQNLPADRRPSTSELASVSELVVMATQWDSATTAGTIHLDDLRADGAEAPVEPEIPAALEPTVVDYFETYTDDGDLREAWGNRVTYASQISLSDDAGEGAQSMAFAYDFDAVASFTDVSRWINGQNWQGQEQLSFRYKPDGSNHQLGVQVRTGNDRFFDAYLPLSGTEWVDVSIPFEDFVLSWPQDGDQGRAPTVAELATVNEVVFFLNEQSSGMGRSGVIPIDTVRADRAEYADPGVVVGPVDPVDPADPGDPVDPVDPADPASPAGPAEPAGPVGPTGPASAASPADLADPADSAAGAGPLAVTGVDGTVLRALGVSALICVSAGAWLLLARRRGMLD